MDIRCICCLLKERHKKYSTTTLRTKACCYSLISGFSLSSPVLEFLNNLWGARNRVGTGLSYRPVRLQSLAESVPWNRFLGSLKVKKFGL
jgi:hypothetical protein